MKMQVIALLGGYVKTGMVMKVFEKVAALLKFGIVLIFLDLANGVG